MSEKYVYFFSEKKGYAICYAGRTKPMDLVLEVKFLEKREKNDIESIFIMVHSFIGVRRGRHQRLCQQ